MPFVKPSAKTRRFFSNLRLNFFSTMLIPSITREAVRNLISTNEYGSMYCSPTLMAGKDVPHRKPARIVRKTAFLLWFCRGDLAPDGGL